MTAPQASEATHPIAAGRPAAMRFILLVVLIDMLAVGLIVPVLAPLVGLFTSSPSEQTYLYGLVIFSYVLASFVGAPVLGALSDRYGRRPILLLGFCGLALNFFATALATALWMLVAARLVGGAMQANAAVANAYVADITPPEQRARRFGLLGAMFGLGFILGPVLGGLLGGISLQLPFFVAGTLALVNLAYGYFVLPESLPIGQRRPWWTGRAPIPGALCAPGADAGHGPAGGGGGLRQPGAVHAVHHLGPVHHVQVRLGPGGKRLVAVRRGHHVGRWCKGCCWAGCSSAFRAQHAGHVGLLLVVPLPTWAVGPGHRGLDDVHRDRIGNLLGAAVGAIPAEPGFQAPPMPTTRARPWARSAA